MNAPDHGRVRYRLAVPVLLAALTGPALAANECREYRAAMALHDAATAAAVWRKGLQPAEYRAAEDAVRETAEALARKATALGATIDDPAARSVFDALDAAGRTADRLWQALLTWYRTGDHEAGAELLSHSAIRPAIADTRQAFLVRLCTGRGQ